MSKVRQLLLIGGVLACASLAAGAQHPTPAPSTPELPAQLSLATRQAILRLGDSLRTAGLSDAPLYAKAAEGVLKGATEARILAAVRALARELGEARAALGTSVDDADLIAAASALHVGATAPMLTQLGNTYRAVGTGERASLATQLVALTDLLARGVPAIAAAAAIDSLAVRRAPADDFAALRAAVARDIGAGRPPEASVVQRTQILLKGIDSRRQP